MKSRQKKSVLKRRRVLSRRVLAAPLAAEPHTVRERMLKRGKVLIKDRDYPRNTIVRELARLFAAKIIAERN